MKRIRLTLTGISMIAALTLSSCKGDDSTAEKEVDTAPIEFKKEGEAYLIKESGDTLKKLDIEFAESDYEKQTGLMYRESMEEDQGMIFLYDIAGQRNFYMKNTYISLDIAYFASDSTLINVQKEAEPLSLESLPSDAPAQFVLEINGGLADEWGLQNGDKISFKKNQ